MTKQVMQFRYYGKKSEKNYPSGINFQNLRDGTIFTPYCPIKQLGIQTMPGVKFSLNRSKDSVIVGSTGIYELNADNLAEISALAFDYTSLNMIENNDQAYIIVDIMYEKY